MKIKTKIFLVKVQYINIWGGLPGLFTLVALLGCGIRNTADLSAIFQWQAL